MVKPQIFLVPGPWHGPEFMSVVATKLEALGYKIHARQFPAVGLSSPPKDLSEDIAALRDLVDLAIDNANGVIVICHSWGGIVTDSELVGWSKSERAAQGKKGVVVRVGYLSAFMPPMGKSLIDMIGGTYPPWFDLKDPVLYVLDPSIFYSDLLAAEQKHWFAQLQCQNLGVMHAPATGESWKAIHSSFLMCEDDLAIPLVGQKAMVKAARDAGGTVDVTRIRAGHSPFLSKPNAIVEWIRGGVGKDLKDLGRNEGSGDRM